MSRDLTVKRAIRSNHLGAWFPAGDNRTEVIAPRRRVVLGTDVTDFVAARLLAGNDDGPWEVPVYNGVPFEASTGQSAESFLEYIASYPTRRNGRGETTAYQVPAMALIDRLIDMDQHSLDVRSDGAVVPRISRPR